MLMGSVYDALQCYFLCSAVLFKSEDVLMIAEWNLLLATCLLYDAGHLSIVHGGHTYY